MNIRGFGKAKYSAPQISKVPEGQTSDQNGTLINESKRQIVVQIFDGGNPQDLALALGTLEIARDIVKATLSSWHMKEQRRNGLLLPKVDGNGGLHVQ